MYAEEKKMIILQSFLIGEANAVVNGNGCNNSPYAPALAHLKELSPNPNPIFNAFLE